MQATSEHQSIWSFRLAIVLLTALSVSLPIAFISLAKFLLFVTGLVFIIANQFTKIQYQKWYHRWSTYVIMVIVVAFALSLFWTEVDIDFALKTFVKHAKLLGILLLVFLIRSEHEARIAITVFVLAQVFILINSWLLFFGFIAPWITNSQADLGTKYVVFSESYLDQSIMFCATAAVLWHLRSSFMWPRWLAIFTALAALLNVLVLLPGRTGYLAAVAVLSLALMWKMNQRRRLITLAAAPFLIVLGLSLSSGQLHDRIFLAVTEVKSNAHHVETGSSSGWRLNAWKRSIEAISEKPLYGYGVGSWTPAIKRLQGITAIEVFGKDNSSNPHQEFLLWGVEMGIGGTLLLLALLISIVKDAREFTPDIQRATLSVVAVIAIACCFNSALFDDLMGDFLCVSIGLLLALGVQSAHQSKRNPPSQAIAPQLYSA